jgi:FSR family fosmidomycin resistance protein-like MFS transporter
MAHFVVDFACFCFLYGCFAVSIADRQAIVMGLLLYNVLAFGLQPLIGALADRYPKAPIAVVGCAFLLAGLLLHTISWFALVLSGFGNACFHIGGGIDSLVHAKGRATRSGIFVSSGAVGVVLGTLYGGHADFSLYVPVFLVGLCLAFILFFAPNQGAGEPEAIFKQGRFDISAYGVLGLCFVSIVVRAYAGAIIPGEWRNDLYLAPILLGIVAAAGKAAGGFAADRFGAKTVGVVTLGVSIPLLCLGGANAAWILLGILLFNMTMPITLCAIASVLPESPGLSFGITTLGLLIGTLPIFFVAVNPAPARVLIAGLTAISGGCILFSTTNRTAK